jgi:hypothetical protein
MKKIIIILFIITLFSVAIIAQKTPRYSDYSTGQERLLNF